MLESIEEIRNDAVSTNLLNLLAGGWMPIIGIIPRLGVDRHTAYKRFTALQQCNLIKKSRRHHKTSRYKIFGFDLTESGEVFVKESKTSPSIDFRFSFHSFQNNYAVNAKLYAYPRSKATMFSTKTARIPFGRALSSFLLELSRSPNIDLGKCQIIFDCKIEPIAELDIYEFYNQCLSPSLRSYITNRTFVAKEELSKRILQAPNYALNLIKLTRFVTDNYAMMVGGENVELINTALNLASKTAEERRFNWNDEVSSLMINVYFFMLAAIYHLQGELPEPERYFELWYFAGSDLERLKSLYIPLLEDLRRKIARISLDDAYPTWSAKET